MEEFFESPIGQLILAFIIIYAIYFAYRIYDTLLGEKTRQKQYKSKSFNEFCCTVKNI